MLDTTLRRLARAALALACCALSLAFARPAHAAWPSTNVGVCTMPGAQNYRTAISDGVGGMFVAWSDGRFVVTDIYAQHVRADGTLAWNANGLNICAAAGRQDQPVLACDGAGGVFIAWKDYRSDANGDIFVQHIDAAGVPQWDYNGVPACKATGQQVDPVIVHDGTSDGVKPSGVLVAWEDERDGPRIYAQRFTSDGSAKWDADGIPVTSQLAAQFEPVMVIDGGEGAILGWSQQTARGYDIYTQHIDPDGSLLWGAAGLPVCTADGNQVRPVLAADSTAGVWLAWQDDRNVARAIYTQHVSWEGYTLLPADGMAVCATSSDQTGATVSADTSGGVFVAWIDNRSGTDIYAQRLDVMGNRQWAAGGVAVCAGGAVHTFPSAVADGTGAVVVAWEDYRAGASDIYAQRLNAAGQAQWTIAGEPVSTASSNQYSPTVVSNGDGTVVMIWSDLRSGNVDLYAMRMPTGAQPALAREEANILAAGPNPATESATFAFEMTAPGRGELTVFDATGRRVRTVTRTDFSVGDHRVPWDARDDSGRRCPEGVYFARLILDGKVAGTRRLSITR